MSFIFSQISRLISRNPKDIFYFFVYYLKTTPSRFRDRFPGKNRLDLSNAGGSFSNLSDRRIPSEIYDSLTEGDQGEIFLSEGVLNLLGKEIHVGWPPVWETRETGSFPKKFSASIPYYGKGISNDIKSIWELGRLQWLIPIAALSEKEDDEKLAEEVFECIFDFAKRHPYGRTTAWMEGIEVSLRAISVLICIGIAPKFEKFRHRDEITYWLGMHGEWISGHLSRKWRMNNNHLLLELIGMIILGSRLPNHQQSNDWKMIGTTILLDELERQTVQGRNWEPTTAYHRFVTEALLILHAFIREDESIRLDAREAIQKYAIQYLETLTKICDDDGVMPLFGDDDAAIVLPRIGKFDPRDSSYTISFARKLGLNVNRERSGLKIWEGHGTGAIWNQDFHLHAVSGAVPGPGKNGSHRHIDMLSITLRARGSDILHDCGTGLYFGSNEWRDYFRSPKRHSGIFSKKREWAKIKGPFEISNTSTGKISLTKKGSLFLSCEMDRGGFATREISLNDWGVELIDILEIESPSINLVLPLDAKIANTGESLEIRGGKFTILCNPAPVAFALADDFVSPASSSSPPEGCAILSPGYGEFDACKILEMSFEKGERVITKIYYEESELQGE